jgi:NAD(P)-dependent dehydrogenase (short-subunit alcohol dehydrogenase family)
MEQLSGRVAIVTGAGAGLGRCYARELARQGAKVVVNDLGTDWQGSGRDERAADAVVHEIRESGGEAVACFGDVASFADARGLIETAVSTYGDLDIVVNNAGFVRDRMVFNMGAQAWDSVIRVHGRGHFCTTRHAAAYWRAKAKRDGQPVYGRLIHTTSESGLYGNPGQPNYDFAKGGIAAFSLAVAHELERYGVTSNAVAPRARTRMTTMTFGEIDREGSGFDDLDPDNVAPFVAFLCTPEAGSISGQVFAVWGGEVQLIEQYQVAGQISNPGRWRVEDLQGRVPELFEGRSSAPRELRSMVKSRAKDDAP